MIPGPFLGLLPPTLPIFLSVNSIEMANIPSLWSKPTLWKAPGDALPSSSPHLYISDTLDFCLLGESAVEPGYDQRRETRTPDELHLCFQQPPVHLEDGDGRRRERRRSRTAKEECACALPLCLSPEADGEHQEDHEDHHQHCHPGSPEPIHQAFLDAPVAVFPAVPVGIRGQAAEIGEGAERREESVIAPASWTHVRHTFEWSSEETNG